QDVVDSIQVTYRHADEALIRRIQETYDVTAEELVDMFLDSIGLTQPVVPWIMDTYGVVPYCWTHWVEFFPQLQRLAEPYTGRAQGLRMKYGRRVVDTHERQARAQQWQDLAARLRGHSATQQLTVQAALAGDRHTALQAFLLDPATSARLEPADTAKLLDEMLRANARYLPRFA